MQQHLPRMLLKRSQKVRGNVLKINAMSISEKLLRSVLTGCLRRLVSSLLEWVLNFLFLERIKLPIHSSFIISLSSMYWLNIPLTIIKFMQLVFKDLKAALEEAREVKILHIIFFPDIRPRKSSLFFRTCLDKIPLRI